MTLDEYLRILDVARARIRDGSATELERLIVSRHDAVMKRATERLDQHFLHGAPKLPVTTDPRRDLVVGPQSEDGDVDPLMPWGDP